MQTPRALLLAAVASSAALASAQLRTYNVTDLGVPPTQDPRAGVTAEAVSPNGRFACGGSVWHPWVWVRGSGMRQLAYLAGGHQSAVVYDVNDSGYGVGLCDVLGNARACIWDPAGNVTALGSLGGAYGVALGIDSKNRVVGTSRAPVGSKLVNHVFSWTAAGGMVDLTPTATVSASILDINERGQLLIVIDGAPARFTPGAGYLSLGSYYGDALNESGQILGSDSNGYAAVYTDGIGWQVFGTQLLNQAQAGAIDSFGQTVGSHRVRTSTSPPNYTYYGNLHTFGIGFQKLDDLVLSSQSVRVGQVAGITDDGCIVAEGSIGSNNRAMLLEPRFVTTYGAGCAGGSGDTPKAIASGQPTAGGRMAILAAALKPQSIAVLLLSPAAASLPLPGGCTLLVDPSLWIVLPATTNTIGQAQVAFTVPPGTRAGPLHVQVASIDTSAANGLFALSNGVRVDLQ